MRDLVDRTWQQGRDDGEVRSRVLAWYNITPSDINVDCVWLSVSTFDCVTYRAFPISWESSLPVVASMRAARALKRDLSSGQSRFIPLVRVCMCVRGVYGAIAGGMVNLSV